MPEYFVVDDGDDGERSYTVETIGEETYRVVTPDEEEFVVEASEPEEGRLHLLRDHASHDVDVRETEEFFEVAMEGRRQHVEVLNEREMRMRTAGVGGRGADDPELVSPIAGTVVEISAEHETSVAEGETVVIVEAMKMENDLKAHRDGVMSEVHVEPGDSVEVGDTLVSISDE